MTTFHEYFICSTCRKIFLEAVKVRNLSNGLEKTYYACPRCLTEVNIQNGLPKSLAPAAPVTRTVPSPPKFSSECPHYENLKKRLIPDECLVCPKLIECTKAN